VSWIDTAATAEAEVARRVERTFADISAALTTEDEPPPPGLLLARTGDLVRSSFFLSLETALQAQERIARFNALVPSLWPQTGRWLPRALVLTSVAADLYLGYIMLRNRARCSPKLVRPRDWQLQHARGATRLLDAAAALGGTLIKAGQIASVRGDLLPAAYVEHLATLQDRVPPHPWSQIEPALVRELRRPLAEVFTRIEEEPVAAASLAQVHRAWLPDGRQVAVKVQYPEIGDLVGADLAALGAIVSSIGCLEPSVRLQPVLEHLRTTLPLELDFGHEAAAMTQLRAALAHRADVLIPTVISELSSGRVVVMEFVEGVKITDRAGLEQAGIDPRAVARLLNDVYAEQMLGLGLLHADPHPGNLLVQPGPRLVLLDHGLTVELRRGLVKALGHMVRALAKGDFARLGEALGQLGFPIRPDTDLGSLLSLAGVLMGNADASEASIGDRLGRVVGDVPLELITVGRALTLLSGITRELDPQLDVLEIDTPGSTELEEILYQHPLVYECAVVGGLRLTQGATHESTSADQTWERQEHPAPPGRAELV
jgi:predicted unusual protein kinase regulating ubiquinone biosynthesis (AarF/ABC1/UbiB family)